MDTETQGVPKTPRCEHCGKVKLSGHVCDRQIEWLAECNDQGFDPVLEIQKLRDENERLRDGLTGPRDLPRGWRNRQRGGRFAPPVIRTLLVSFTVPLDAGLAEDADANDMAEAIERIVNEEWFANARHEPDYFEPLGVSLFPEPQWVTTESLAVLRKAAELTFGGHTDG